MTHEDILLVQFSWRKVLPDRNAAAELFYLKLFELDPGAALAVHGRHGTARRKVHADDHAPRCAAWIGSTHCCR